MYYMPLSCLLDFRSLAATQIGVRRGGGLGFLGMGFRGWRVWSEGGKDVRKGSRPGFGI